jgi:hypothetical protein
MVTTFANTARLVGADPKLDRAGVAVREVKTTILYTIDDLVFNRSQTIPDVPLVAYPATAKGKSDYAHYTAKDLDRFADHGARKYTSMGLKPEAG